MAGAGLLGLIGWVGLGACRPDHGDAYPDAGHLRALPPELARGQAPPGRGPGTADRYASFAEAFTEAARRAVPAVVSIANERRAEPGGPEAPRDGDDPFAPFFGGPGRERAPGGGETETGLGSGVLISAQGYILTNNHVIEGARTIRVRLHDGREFQAEVVGADPPSDVAVIRLRGAAGALPVLPLGDSDKLRVGQWVVAVGNPYGLSQTVTSGIISAKGRKHTGINHYEDFLQTDAAINPGNSGGALMDLRGELIGINTAIYSQSGGYQGIGFAIPINLAKRVMEDLIRDGEVTRGWLGVSVQAVGLELGRSLRMPPGRGVLVREVMPGSPAERAGLRRGDVIRGVDGAGVADDEDLLNTVARLRPGHWARLDLVRKGKSLSLRARVGRRNEGRVARAFGRRSGEVASPAELGLKLARLDRRLRRRFRVDRGLPAGVIILSVEENSEAAYAGLRPGDVIFAANGGPVADLGDFHAALERGGRGNRILLIVRRDGQDFYAALNIRR